MEIKALKVDIKEAWVDYTGVEGFSVKVAAVSRNKLIQLRKKCTQPKFDRKLRITTEELDEALFIKLFSEAVVKDWKGLTVDGLQGLMLIDVEGHDLEEEVEYSPENAQMLVKESQEFDTWLNEVVFNLDNFRN
jgi:hypothetical protein